MQGAAIHASVRTHYGDRTHDCHVEFSRRGIRFAADLWQVVSVYLLTPEALVHAIQQSAGHRINMTITGSFVGTQSFTANVDIRERVAPSFPLRRAGVFIELLPTALRFVLSCEGTSIPPNTDSQSKSQNPAIRPTEIEIEFELPDQALSVALQEPNAEKLANEILAAKTQVLSRKSVFLAS